RRVRAYRAGFTSGGGAIIAAVVLGRRGIGGGRGFGRKGRGRMHEAEEAAAEAGLGAGRCADRVGVDRARGCGGGARRPKLGAAFFLGGGERGGDPRGELGQRGGETGVDSGGDLRGDRRGVDGGRRCDGRSGLGLRGGNESGRARGVGAAGEIEDEGDGREDG